MKLNNAELNRTDEMMSKNFQSSNEQNVNIVQYTIRRYRPTNECKGEIKGGIHMNANGGVLGLSPLRSDGSQGILAGLMRAQNMGRTIY